MADKLKSFYIDGLLPTDEHNAALDDMASIIQTVFKKYVDEGYSPREITGMLHAVVGRIGAIKSVELTMERVKGRKKKSNG
jgi:hypothetical protein